MGIQDDLLEDDHRPGDADALQAASKMNLDAGRSSRILEMQMQTGLPEPFIDRNLETVETEAFGDFDAEQFRKNSPIFAAWAAENPHNWGAVQDDIENLNALEWAVTAFKGKYEEGTVEVRLNQIWAQHQAGLATDEDLAEAEELEGRLENTHGYGAGWWGEFITEFGQQAPQMSGGMASGARVGMTAGMGTALIAGVAGQAGPQIAIPEEIVTVPTAFVLGGTAGFLSGSALWADEQERGAAFREMSRITDENGRKIDPEIARTAATWVGLINAGLEATGTAAVAKNLPGVKQLRESIVKDSIKEALKSPTFRRAIGEFAKNTATAVSTEVATEVMQESVSMFAAEFAKLADPGDYQSITAGEFADNLQMIAEKTFKATLIPGAAGPMVNLGIDARRVRVAQTNQRIFEALGEAAENSNLRERVPKKFQEFVERVRERGPVDAIRVPVEQFKEYFQSKDLDAAQMYEQLGGTVEAFMEAEVAGVDLEIDLEQYATKIAPTEHHGALIGDLRLHPDDMTANEATAWQENSEQLLKDLDAGIGDDTRPGYDVIFDDVMGQMTAANMEEGAAEQNATLMASVFATLGERTGMDPEVLYQRYGLNVTRQMPEILTALKDVDTEIDPLLDRLRAGDVPSDRDAFGPSAMDYLKSSGGIIDQGGELEARDVRRELRGLVTGEGMTLDGAAEVLGEAGYIGESTVDTMLEALDRELQGDPVFAPQLEDQKLSSLKGTLDELQNFLDTQQIDVGQLSNSQIKELLRGDTFSQLAPEQFEVDRSGDGQQFVIRATDGNEDIGRMETEFHDDTNLQIVGVQLSPDFRGQQIGQQLIAQAYQLAQQEGRNLVSDGAVSALQLRAYEGLKRRGWTIEYADNEKVQDLLDLASEAEDRGRPVSGLGVAADQGPVVTRIEPPAETTFFQEGEAPKASIRISEATRQVTINLTNASDLSSFLHESGHFYLEILGDLAEAADAPKQITEDYAALLKWMGTENRQGISRDQHEQFARGFEAYLMEGKAPSVELQSAFARFRAWLVGIYRKLASLNVELSNDIRGVFDRMVATDDAIAQAEEAENYVALFTDAESAGMTQEQFDVYRNRIQRARIEAEESLSNKLLSVLKREQKKWWKAERENMRESVAEEVHQMRVYRAMSFLQKGETPNGQKLNTPHVKLAKADLVATYGKEFLKRLPKPWVYTVEGGMSTDEAALLFGYSSGDEMVQELVNARSMNQVIEAETDARLAEKYPDPLTDGSIAEEAINSVHSDKRAELLAAEMRTLKRLARQDRPAVSAALRASKRQQKESREANRGNLPDRDELKLIKAAAAQMIGRKKVRSITPHTFRNAESKAARLAFEAAGKGNYEQAYLEKRRQVLNHELYRAAEKARAESGKIRDYFAKFSKKTVRERLGKAQDGVLEKIETILDAIDLRRISGAQIDRNQVKRDILDQIESGAIVATPQVVSALQNMKTPNWRELTMDNLRGMRDIVKQLETQARRQAEMVIQGEKLNFDIVSGEIAENLRKVHKKRTPNIGEPTPAERRKEGAKELINAWLRPSSIARVLDNDDYGPVMRYIIEPIRQAYAEKLIPMQRKAREDVAELYAKHYSNAELVKFNLREKYETLDADLNKKEVLSIALNWGNEGNREALLNGITNGDRAYSQAGVIEALQTLDARDWVFVQDVWDYLDSYWGELSAAQKRRRGITPDKVASSPFTMTTNTGEVVNVKGGYYPLKYDSRHADRQKERDVQDYFDKMGNGFYVSANTRAGATHERVGSAYQVVRLGLGIINQHLDEITRDIAIGDEVNFVKRLLNHKEIRSAMRETGNKTALSTLNLWLQDSAVGELQADGTIEKGLAWVRVGFTKSKLGWNLLTTALQITGMAQTWAVVGSQAMSHGLGRYMKNPVAMDKFIKEQSAFMRTRYEANAWNKDVADAQEFISSAVPTRYSKAMRQISSTYFLPIMKAQMIVDEVTWLAAFWEGVEKRGLSDGKATQYADSIVEKAQTSGFFSDRSGIERGTAGWRNTRQSQFVRIWTTLISYMLAKANIAYEKGASFSKKPTLKGTVHLMMDYFALFTIEAMLSMAIYGRFWDEDDDESFAWWATKETVASAVAGVPGGRDLMSAQFNSGNTPLGSLIKDMYDVSVQVGQGEFDAALTKEVNNVLGTIFHYPSSQTNRALDAMWRESEGEDVPLYEYFLGDRNRDD